MFSIIMWLDREGTTNEITKETVGQYLQGRRGEKIAYFELESPVNGLSRGVTIFRGPQSPDFIRIILQGKLGVESLAMKKVEFVKASNVDDLLA